MILFAIGPLMEVFTVVPPPKPKNSNPTVTIMNVGPTKIHHQDMYHKYSKDCFAISAHRVDSLPWLKTILEHFNFIKSFNVALDNYLIEIKKGQHSFGEVWEILTPEERYLICELLKGFKEWENLHLGMLALLPIDSVIKALALTNNLERHNEAIKESLRGMRKNLSTQLYADNPLLKRLKK